MKNFDVKHDRDIKEVKEDGTIVYKPRYDNKHTKRQRVPNRAYEGDYV